MGHCSKCGKELSLNKNETTCDNCGAIIKYVCHDCRTPFLIEKENNIRLKECGWCGYFICPTCHICGVKCQSTEHKKFIYKLLHPMIKPEGYSELNARINEIIDYFETVKLGKERKDCPEGVPISYAKGRIKSILAKLKGFRVKDNFDKDAWEKRQKIISEQPAGFVFKIGDIKEAGTYGQEWGDTFNLCICYGLLKYEVKKFKDENGVEIEYDSWIRVNNIPCPMFDLNNLIIKRCPNCKVTFSKEISFCPKCKYKKDSQNHKKGEAYVLKEKITNKDICQLKRGDFVHGHH